MKRTLFGFTAAALLATGSASATILASEDFSYADGSLVPNGGWANHSGTAGDLLVSGGAAVIQHGTPSEDANLAFTATPGTLYYGLDFSVNASGTITGTDNEYFAHFKDTGFNFSARLDIVAAQSTGDYTVGIASDDSVADAIWATDLSFNTVYRAIVAYDQATNQAELWIDPASMASTSILGDDQPDPGDTVSQFALRQSDSDLNETVTVDNVIVATSFAEVVPEPSSLALLGLGGLLIARRRRG